MARVGQDRISLPERYRVVGHIASGGMASVWEAHDSLLDRPVAVKLLAAHLSSDSRARRRFAREARAAAGLSSHPHVVTIYDVGEFDDRAFMVMELLRGGTLADRIDATRGGRRGAADDTMAASGGAARRRAAETDPPGGGGAASGRDERTDALGRGRGRGGAPSLAVRLRWLREAASALDAAHAAGVVHRDIKPGNLLLDRQERLAVADFGIARVAWEDQLTLTGQVLGTAAYLSPEQAVGEAASPASDRYALAVVAYELLTGVRPFEAAHFAAQARAHVEDPVPPASSRTVDGSLSRAADATLERALAKDPADRWPSADAFVTALERTLTPGEQGASRRRFRRAAAATPPNDATAPRPAAPTTPRPSDLHPGAASGDDGGARREDPARRGGNAAAYGDGTRRSDPARHGGGAAAYGDGTRRSDPARHGGGAAAYRRGARRGNGRASRARGGRRAVGFWRGVGAAAVVLVLAVVAVALATRGGDGSDPRAQRTPDATRAPDRSPTPTPRAVTAETATPTATPTPTDTPTPEPTPTATPDQPADADPSELERLGHTALLNGDVDEALSTLQAAVAACGDSQQVDPCAYAMYDYADALLRAGRADEAAAILRQRLARFDDQNDTVRDLLDKAERASGGDAAARGATARPRGTRRPGSSRSGAAGPRGAGDGRDTGDPSSSTTRGWNGGATGGGPSRLSPRD